MNAPVNEEAKEAIARFFNDTREHISKVSVRYFCDKKIYTVEIGKYLNIDEIDHCEIIEKGHRSKLIGSTTIYHDQQKMEHSKEVSMSIEVLINMQPLNRYEEYIRKYMDELISLR
jgi:hypothetical protein